MSEGAAERHIRLPAGGGSGSSGTYGTGIETRVAGSVSSRGVVPSWTVSEVVRSSTWSSASAVTTGAATGNSGALVSLGAGLASREFSKIDVKYSTLLQNIKASFKETVKQQIGPLDNGLDNFREGIYTLVERYQKVPHST